MKKAKDKVECWVNGYIILKIPFIILPALCSLYTCRQNVLISFSYCLWHWKYAYDIGHVDIGP